MKPQGRPQARAFIGDQAQTVPLTLEQCRQLNPGFWATLARIQARIEREMRGKRAEGAHDESEQPE